GLVWRRARTYTTALKTVLPPNRAKSQALGFHAEGDHKVTSALRPTSRPKTPASTAVTSAPIGSAGACPRGWSSSAGVRATRTVQASPPRARLSSKLSAAWARASSLCEAQYPTNRATAKIPLPAAVKNVNARAGSRLEAAVMVVRVSGLTADAQQVLRLKLSASGVRARAS